MRIAYVITRADAVGGASIHVRDMAAEMIERGQQAQVFVGGTGPVIDQMQLAGVPVQSIRSLQRDIHPLQDWAAYRELKGALETWSPHLVSTHTAKAGWLGRAAARSLGIPSIYTPHGWSISNRISKRQGAAYAFAERFAAPWSKAIVCVSEAERQLAVDHRVGRPDQLHVIHNGVRDVPADLQAKPEGDAIRLISIARFEAPKDHYTLFDALSRLKHRDWELELVGDGPLETEIRRLAVEFRLRGRAEFKGYMPDPAKALAGASIFVLSSRSEGFPRSILEAMRAGLPVVASNVGGVSEAIKDGLVPPGDAEAMASEIAALMDDPQLRLSRGIANRAEYEQSFRLERMVYKTEALYRTVLGQPQKPQP